MINEGGMETERDDESEQEGESGMELAHACVCRRDEE